MNFVQPDGYIHTLGARVHPLANLVGDDIVIGEGSRIDAFVTLTGKVRIGRNCHISTGASVFGGGGFFMGDYSGLSPGVKVFTSTEDVSGEWFMHPTSPEEYRQPITKSIRIGDHCAVCANAVLLPGADLPDGVVIGALSLVKRPVMSWSVWAGVPVVWLEDRSRKVLDLVNLKEAECSLSA